MIAFDLFSANYLDNVSSMGLNAFAYNSSFTGDVGQHRTEMITDIWLEACTVDHFSKFPDIQLNFKRLRASQWLCLPLNH